MNKIKYILRLNKFQKNSNAVKEKQIKIDIQHIRLLSSMISAGISPVDSFTSLGKNTYSKIIDRFAGGANFSQALELSDLSRRSGNLDLIISAEKVGKIPHVLNHIAGLLDESKSRTASIVTIAIYPIIVMCIASVLLLLVLFFVIPNILPVIAGGTESGLITKALVFGSHILRSHGMWVLFIHMLLLIGVFFSLSDARVQAWLENLILKIPKIKNFYINYLCANYVSVLYLHIEYTHNLPLSFRRVAADSGSLHFKNKFNFIANQIEEGNNLSAAIISAENLPEIWVIYAKTAEKSSTYNKMFADLCGYYKTILSNQINFLIKISEPVLMVIIGLLVGILAYGILSPLYGIMNQLN